MHALLMPVDAFFSSASANNSSIVEPHQVRYRIAFQPSKHPKEISTNLHGINGTHLLLSAMFSDIK